MAKLRSKSLLALAFLFLAPSLASAAGFRIPDQSAKAMGMANAATAQGDEAAAIYYNPAAAGQLDGTYVQTGATVIYALGADFKSDIPATLPDEVGDDQVFVPGFLYFVSDFGTQRWTFGIAANSPFGLSRDWDKGSARRTPGATPGGFKKNVDRVNLVTGYIQPTVGYQVFDDLYVSVFAQYLISKLNINAQPLFNAGPGGVREVDELDLSADGDGWGYGAAAFWKINDQWSVGATYRSEITVDYDGHAEANDINPALQPAVGGRPAFETDLETHIHFPAQAMLGVAFKLNDQWLFEADLDYTGWRSFQDVDVRLGAQLTPIGFTNAALSAKEDWHNVFAYRVGAQYTLNDAWKFRAGYVFDDNPIPDETVGPVLPDSDRHGLTVGVGHQCTNGWTFDFSYMALFFEDRDVNNIITTPQNPVQDGSYENMAHLWAFSAQYKF